MGGCSGEACKHRDDSPTDQYPSDPNTRTDFVHQQVAGYFKNEVAKEEDSATNPNCWLLTPSSLFMVKAANPILILSMNAIMKRTNTNGIIRVRSLRTVVASIAPGARAGLAPTPHPRDGSAQCSTGRQERPQF